MNYWKECITEAFEDAGIDATEDQINTVTSWVEGAHENYGMATGRDCIPNPLQSENRRLQEALKTEQEKITCPECNGSGLYKTQGPYHSAEGQCFRCRGDGRCIR